MGWLDPGSLRFSDGPDLILKNEHGNIWLSRRHDRERIALLEELIVKYGTFEQMHF